MKSELKAYSYWLEELPSPSAKLAERLSDETDVAIVGSGYTGLNAALETSRGGRSTMVLDSSDPGFGCSTRNGGQVSTSIKPMQASLARKFGAERARAIRGEGEAALAWIEERVANERIDCDFRRSGRFHAAHTPRHYEQLVRNSETMREEGIEFNAVPRSEQRSELGTDWYYGGVVYPQHASLHPARYHRGLLNSVLAEGGTVVGNCAVLNIEREPEGFVLATERGPVRARDVIVATNGYTSSLTQWLQRRVIPIGSYIIATEPLPPDLIDRLFPKNRVTSDTRKVVYYYRTSPDGTRILFGGRVSANETDPARSGPKLYAEMCRIFPELRNYGIAHSWMGTVAYTFDELAHVGVHEGIHYALGYCGSGVSMASYLGMRIGQRVLGSPEGRTAFDDLPFPARPLYSGNPWFLPSVVAWYRWRDNWQVRRARMSDKGMHHQVG